MWRDTVEFLNIDFANMYLNFEHGYNSGKQYLFLEALY